MCLGSVLHSSGGLHHTHWLCNHATQVGWHEEHYKKSQELFNTTMQAYKWILFHPGALQKTRNDGVTKFCEYVVEKLGRLPIFWGLFSRFLLVVPAHCQDRANPRSSRAQGIRATPGWKLLSMLFRCWCDHDCTLCYRAKFHTPPTRHP